MNKFTEAQLSAIIEPTKNILVSAAAGSGKTTVLAERIFQKITKDKINIDELLIVTYTKSAAADMKERIIKNINNELSKEDLSKELVKNNTKQDINNFEFLKEQLTRINKAQISTIDSFCSKVVKNNFKYLDIDPNFKVGSEHEHELLKSECLELFLESFYQKKENLFISTLNAFNNKADDESFKEIFLKVHQNSKKMINPNKWISQSAQNFNFKTKDDYINSKIFKNVIKYTKSYLLDIIKIYEKIKFITTGVLDFNNINRIRDEASAEYFLYQEFIIYEELLDDINNNNYIRLDILKDKKFQNWNKFPIKAKDDRELRDLIKEQRDTIKNLHEELVKKFYYKSMTTIVEDNKKIYPIIENFCSLIIEFDEFYMNIKKERKLFTFDDISHFCLELLLDENNMPSLIAKEYQSMFKEVIIDEYQDSNSIHDKILEAVSNNNRFMVGDIKQCIYKFRQANPKLFYKKYVEYFDNNDNNEENKNNIRIDLNANFRSSQEVVDAVNIIFENIMNIELGEVEYDNSAKLKFSAIMQEPLENQKISDKCELVLINGEIQEIQETKELGNTNINFENFEVDDDEELLDLKNAEIEAHYIAQKIQSFFNDDIYVTRENILQKVEYRDIVILLRSSSNAEVFSKILEDYNIPCYTEASNQFYDYIEIKIIINLLKILDNPLQDIALISVMYSSIFNFKANELLEIKLIGNGKNKLFWNDILEYINKEDISKEDINKEDINKEDISKEDISKEDINEIIKKDSFIEIESNDISNISQISNKDKDKDINIKLKQKCIDFLDKIDYWQKLSQTFSINELLSFIYQDSNYYNYLGLLKNGNIKQANLIMLLEEALEFEKSSLSGLFSFIIYIEKIKEIQKNENNKKSNNSKRVSFVSEDENIVRIMTTHKSKGLEFPIVFFSSLNKKFNETSLNKDKILFDDNLNLGCSMYVDILESNNNYYYNNSRKSITTIQKNTIKHKIRQETYSEEMRILYVALTRAKEKLILTGVINKKFDESIKKMQDLIYTDSNTGTKNLVYNNFVGKANNYLSWVYTTLYNFDEKNIWDIHMINREDIIEKINNKNNKNNKNNNIDITKSNIFKDIFDKNNKNNIKNLDWEPSILQNLYSTISVSEIKRVYKKSFLDTSNDRREKVFEMPKFYIESNEELLPVEIGTTYHKILENIDFNIKYKKDLSDIFEMLLLNNLITQRELEAIDKNKLISFLNSDIVKRIQKALRTNPDSVKREAVFTIGIPPSEIYADEILKELDSSENILVSGIMDLYFEEEDYIVLVDYKSDKIKSDKIFIDTYKPQLSIYKKALENATNKQVKECYIYSILNERAIPVVF